MEKIGFFMLIKPFLGCSCQDGVRARLCAAPGSVWPSWDKGHQGKSTACMAGIAAHPERGGTAASVLPQELC